MNPNNAPQEHSVHPAGSPSREHAAEAGVDVTDTVVWTRHGMGTSEWWSHGPFTVRKDRQWLLRRNGELLSQHEYLQGALAEAELCSHARAEAARQDVEEEATAPQAVPLPVAREPLSLERIRQCYDVAHGRGPNTVDTLSDFSIAVARAIEAAHGIAHPAGQIAEAPTGPDGYLFTQRKPGTISQFVSIAPDGSEGWPLDSWHTVTRAPLVESGPREEIWRNEKLIAAHAALCERLPEASGSDVKEPAAEPASAPKEKP